MINFIKYRFVYLAISAVVIGAGIVSIATVGYQYSVDFVGGTSLQYAANKDVSLNELNSALKSHESNTKEVEVNEKQIDIRIDAMEAAGEPELRSSLENALGANLTLERMQTVGPTLGAETVQKMLIATLFGIVAIFTYVAYAFKGVHFALAAIVALVHDVLVVLGVYSIIAYFGGGEFDTLFVTALLTTMSFSVHDTIIIFDKVREYRRTYGTGDVAMYANRALTETLIRSINNSMTIVFMLLALTLLGGSTIRFFIIALLIGTITGTYSSPFVATPVWVWLEKHSIRRGKKKSDI